MKIKRTTTYALMAILELSREPPGIPLARSALAARANMPARYLQEVLHRLKQCKIVESCRGVRGGFSLARPISEIGILEVIEAFEVPVESSPDDLSLLDPVRTERLIALLQGTHEATRDYLKRFSVATLEDKTDSHGHSKVVFHFHDGPYQGRTIRSEGPQNSDLLPIHPGQSPTMER
jgi:Rrf2 family protein